MRSKVKDAIFKKQKPLLNCNWDLRFILCTGASSAPSLEDTPVFKQYMTDNILLLDNYLQHVKIFTQAVNN